MLLRQLFDAESSTYTYIVADFDSKQSAIIDPVLEQVNRDAQLITELGLTLSYIMETHVHADHITGAGLLQKKLGGQIVGATQGAPCANLHLKDGEKLLLGALSIEAIATPGHTNDSLSFKIKDHLFTGDALLVRTCGRTDFQHGDPGLLYDVIHERIFSLPDNTLIWPGHDYKGHTVSSVGEEKRLNARLAGKTRDEFIHIMNTLNLPRPKRMDEAVPANLRCGLKD